MKMSGIFLKKGKNQQKGIVQEMCKGSGPNAMRFPPAYPEDNTTQQGIQYGKYAKIAVGQCENQHTGPFTHDDGGCSVL